MKTRAPSKSPVPDAPETRIEIHFVKIVKMPNFLSIVQSSIVNLLVFQNK